VIRSIDWAKVDSTLEESQKALAELLQNH
jgi:hypothetical protein